jgi:hypothetical protein
MPLVEQELFILQEHPSSPPVFFCRVRVAQLFVLCVVFCRSLFVSVLFHFGHCIVCPFSIYCYLFFLFTITLCNNIELLNNLVRLVYNIKFFSIHFKMNRGTVVVSVWQLDLQLPMQSVLIMTKVVSSNHAHDGVYSI